MALGAQWGSVTLQLWAVVDRLPPWPPLTHDAFHELFPSFAVRENHLGSLKTPTTQVEPCSIHSECLGWEPCDSSVQQRTPPQPCCWIRVKAS